MFPAIMIHYSARRREVHFLTKRRLCSPRQVVAGLARPPPALYFVPVQKLFRETTNGLDNPDPC
jgi:hypothetical protein